MRLRSGYVNTAAVSSRSRNNPGNGGIRLAEFLDTEANLFMASQQVANG